MACSCIETGSPHSCLFAHLWLGTLHPCSHSNNVQLPHFAGKEAETWGAPNRPAGSGKYSPECRTLGQGVTCSHAAPSWSEEELQPVAQPLSSAPAMGPPTYYWSTFFPPRPAPVKPHPGTPSTPCFSVWRRLEVKGHPCFPMPGWLPWARTP